MATWPPSTTALTRLEALRKQLAQGIDNPVTHPGIVENLYSTVRSITDLRPTREDMRLNPIEWLVKALQWLSNYDNLPQGPLFFNTGSVAMNWTGSAFDFTFNHRYEGSASDPAGAAKIEVQVGIRSAGSDLVTWSEPGWYLTINAPLSEHTGQLACPSDQAYFSYRARFVNSSNGTLSAWSNSDERFIADT